VQDFGVEIEQAREVIDGAVVLTVAVRPMRAEAMGAIVVMTRRFGHDSDPKRTLRLKHRVLPMTQEVQFDAVIRARVRGLRLARGWSLDALAARCHVSASTLSRIETGHRRIAIDQLVLIARALGSSLDQLVEPVTDGDVVIRPTRDRHNGATLWRLTGEDEPQGIAVAKMRITARRPASGLNVHPGHEWFTVLSGIARLHLGSRVILVEAGQAAQFSTMSRHAITAHEGPVEIIVVFDRDGRRAHFDAVDLTDGA
jgi:transcriptional regulator with XRE-family HTH domain